MTPKRKNGVVSARSSKAIARKKRSTLSMLRRVPGRTKQLVKSHPVRVIVGAAAFGLMLAKLKHVI